MSFLLLALLSFFILSVFMARYTVENIDARLLMQIWKQTTNTSLGSSVNERNVFPADRVENIEQNEIRLLKVNSNKTSVLSDRIQRGDEELVSSMRDSNGSALLNNTCLGNVTLPPLAQDGIFHKIMKSDVFVRGAFWDTRFVQNLQVRLIAVVHSKTTWNLHWCQLWYYNSTDPISVPVLRIGSREDHRKT